MTLSQDNLLRKIWEPNKRPTLFWSEPQGSIMFPISEGTFQQTKWLAHERFKVSLYFDPEKVSDQDLQRLLYDASKLLGQPVGHEYASQVIEAIIDVFTFRAIERRHNIEK